MLMLKGNELEKTEVLAQRGNQVQKVQGATYKQRLFTQNGSFSKANEKEALDHCRKLFTDSGEKQMVLFVENEDNFSVWMENSNVKPVGKSTDRVSSLSLKAVVAKMRTVDGIKIKDRQYRFKTYPNCFLGNEAVRWFMHHLQLTSDEAMRLGQRLIDEKWFHHVLDAHDFKDEELFYRFYWDEE